MEIPRVANIEYICSTANLSLHFRYRIPWPIFVCENEIVEVGPDQPLTVLESPFVGLARVPGRREGPPATVLSSDNPPPSFRSVVNDYAYRLSLRLPLLSDVFRTSTVQSVVLFTVLRLGQLLRPSKGGDSYNVNHSLLPCTLNREPFSL